MWRQALVLCLLLTGWTPLRAQGDLHAAAFSPQDCSLECLRQGDEECKYCRITQGDLRKALGSKYVRTFGSCIPRPCFELLGNQNAELCQHYVHAPSNVTVEFVDDPDSTSDTVVVSWRPSLYGIAFLRGFQVTLQDLGRLSIMCQLFLFHQNLSLPASHAQKVYRSDPFRGLLLGSQYSVTVMALPVPEKWKRFYHTEMFSTRSCTEKNGINQCKQDWYPQHINIEQNGTTVTVTFNLAPQNLGIRSYFSICYTEGTQIYTDITPNITKNNTHHTHQLQDLQEGKNYSCEIAANEVDAVRKTFNVQVRIQNKHDSLFSTSPVALLLPLGLALAAIIIVFVAVFTLKRAKMKIKKMNIVPGSDLIKELQESKAQEELMSLPRNSPSPPRLLICYSSYDGPAHVKAVMQLGAFIQQHMATQVCLDLWDSLSVSAEGSMAWHCRQIRDCDFVLVICSRGLSHKPEPPEQNTCEEEESNLESDYTSAEAAISLIGAEVGHAKARGQDLSKYMAAIFEYSEQADIPTELSLVSHYTLTCDLPLLFSHLHNVALHRPGGYLKISHISEQGFTQLPAGAALQSAIYEAGLVMKEKRCNSLQASKH